MLVEIALCMLNCSTAKSLSELSYAIVIPSRISRAAKKSAVIHRHKGIEFRVELNWMIFVSTAVLEINFKNRTKLQVACYTSEYFSSCL